MYDKLKATDDGLGMNEVGPWTYDKYALIEMYMSIFARSMNGKWKATCFVDLYAGMGLSHVQNTSDVLKGSPLLALDVPVPFTSHVFCESSPSNLQVLRQRVASRQNVTLISGDCNTNVKAVTAAIPSNALTLCFVDPFDLSINMQTLRTIAQHGQTDFLCLVASGMDANRNVTNYENTSSKKVECFLGEPHWRERWRQAKSSHEEFVDFLAREFAKGMEKLGYLPTPKHRFKRMVNSRNSPLYHLALFSKSELAFKFWDQVLKYSTPQRGLFD